jgi:hypothetical protein
VDLSIGREYERAIRKLEIMMILFGPLQDNRPGEFIDRRYKLATF